MYMNTCMYQTNLQFTLHMYIVHVHINTTSLTHVHVPLLKKKTMPLHTKTAIHVNTSNCTVFKTSCVSLIMQYTCRELHFAHLQSGPVSIEVMHHSKNLHIQVSGKILRILYLKPALTCTWNDVLQIKPSLEFYRHKTAL